MEELILKAQNGDRDAFDQLVRGRNKLVLNLAAGYLGWKDAEDAAQIIWLAVWRKLWQVEDPKKFAAWLRTLVLHQCLNLRKTRAGVWKKEVQLSPQAWLGLADCITGDSFLTEEMLEHKELRTLIDSKLDQLPGEYGILLRMYYLDELSYKQLAAITGLPQSTLKWRLHQGRKLFKVSLAQHLAQQDIRRFS